MKKNQKRWFESYIFKIIMVFTTIIIMLVILYFDVMILNSFNTVREIKLLMLLAMIILNIIGMLVGIVGMTIQIGVMKKMRLTVRELQHRFNVDIWYSTSSGQRFYHCKDMKGNKVFDYILNLKEVEERLKVWSDEE